MINDRIREVQDFIDHISKLLANNGEYVWDGDCVTWEPLQDYWRNKFSEQLEKAKQELTELKAIKIIQNNKSLSF